MSSSRFTGCSTSRTSIVVRRSSSARERAVAFGIVDGPGRAAGAPVAGPAPSMQPRARLREHEPADDELAGRVGRRARHGRTSRARCSGTRANCSCAADGSRPRAATRKRWRSASGSFTITLAAKPERSDGRYQRCPDSGGLSPCAASRRVWLAGACWPAAAGADEVVVMTSGAFTAPFQDAAPWFERRTGHDVVGVFGASTGGAAGLDPDAARARRARRRRHRLGASARRADRGRRGRAPAHAATSCCRGSAWPCAPARRNPTSRSVDALVRTLREAKSIAYSASVSGTYLSTELFPRLGLAEEIAAKGRRIESERVGAVVARGDAEIGFQQISELVTIDGIDYVGPLPDEVQRVSTFSAGIADGRREPRGRARARRVPRIGRARARRRALRARSDRLRRRRLAAAVQRPRPDGLDAEDPPPRARRQLRRHVPRHATGCSTVAYDGYDTFAEQFGHLFFAEPFSHYRLRIEYRFVGAQAPERAGLGRAQQRRHGAFASARDDAARPGFSDLARGAVLGGLRRRQARGRPAMSARRARASCTPAHRIRRIAFNRRGPTIDGDAWVTAEVLVLGDERVVHYIDGLPVIEYGDITYGGGNVNGHDPASEARRRAARRAATSRCRARAIRSSFGASSS